MRALWMALLVFSFWGGEALATNREPLSPEEIGEARQRWTNGRKQITVENAVIEMERLAGNRKWKSAKILMNWLATERKDSDQTWAALTRATTSKNHDYASHAARLILVYLVPTVKEMKDPRVFGVLHVLFFHLAQQHENAFAQNALVEIITFIDKKAVFVGDFIKDDSRLAALAAQIAVVGNPEAVTLVTPWVTPEALNAALHEEKLPVEQRLAAIETPEQLARASASRDPALRAAVRAQLLARDRGFKSEEIDALTFLFTVTNAEITPEGLKDAADLFLQLAAKHETIRARLLESGIAVNLERARKKSPVEVQWYLAALNYAGTPPEEAVEQIGLIADPFERDAFRAFIGRHYPEVLDEWYASGHRAEALLFYGRNKLSEILEGQDSSARNELLAMVPSQRSDNDALGAVALMASREARGLLDTVPQFKYFPLDSEVLTTKILRLYLISDRSTRLGLSRMLRFLWAGNTTNRVASLSRNAMTDKDLGKLLGTALKVGSVGARHNLLVAIKSMLEFSPLKTVLSADGEFISGLETVAVEKKLIWSEYGPFFREFFHYLAKATPQLELDRYDGIIAAHYTNHVKLSARAHRLRRSLDRDEGRRYGLEKCVVGVEEAAESQGYWDIEISRINPRHTEVPKDEAGMPVK